MAIDPEDPKDGMDFEYALRALKEGLRVRRSGWHGKYMHLEMQHPDEYSRMTRPYVFIQLPDGSRVPWLCSQTDLLAEDWSVVLVTDDEAEEA